MRVKIIPNWTDNGRKSYVIMVPRDAQETTSGSETSTLTISVVKPETKEATELGMR